MTLILTLDKILTPLGIALVLTDKTGTLRALDWSDYEDRLYRLLRLHYGTDYEIAEGMRLSKASLLVGKYFAGDLKAINKIKVETNGTPFQKKVWAALRKVPAGKTITYAALAKKVGSPSAVRAVGAANGANPIGVVVPCHRMIGTSGKLTGYGGGLHRKQWLLVHEGALPDT
ncbi:MAG: Methylated-DNA--protein-cysteine methyltransferase [Rhodospirillales bacterium]|jgi:methylated-DNA-[protein]-cysteine S-methyltransferase|nr:Methylated-DNA--protein-cysteine methyltransferase [Rhodospirillales bacterium]